VSDSSSRMVGDRELLAARVRVPQHVVFREFPAETVVLNLQTEQYHGLNPTAGAMLTELGRSSTVSEAAVAVARQFDRSQDEVREHLVGLCAQLLERGLIEIVPDES
jgi:Coenzyme PQQ synthesis protein D (PqqD)